jgi:hypothetical protein
MKKRGQRNLVPLVTTQEHLNPEGEKPLFLSLSLFFSPLTRSLFHVVLPLGCEKRERERRRERQGDEERERERSSGPWPC